MSSTPQITFVCCIESGSLESQTIRMVQSLRQYGGRLADAPLVAVTPRFGPPLNRKTHQIFDICQVEHLYIRPDSQHSQYSWNNFINKPCAVMAVNERAKTEAIGWLDSDILFVGEPDQLGLQADESFLACTSDQIGATTGPGDPLEPYWQAICQNLNLDIEALPWVTTQIEHARVRYYFNSGVFVYRRATAFAKQYLEFCIRILDSHIASKECGFFFADQIAMALASAKLNLSWRSLPLSHNYALSPKMHDVWYNEDKLRDAKIVHYHDAMWLPFWTTFLQCMQDTHPDVAEWLHSLGPMKNETPPLNRLLSRGLKYFRSKKLAAYQASCSVV